MVLDEENGALTEPQDRRAVLAEAFEQLETTPPAESGRARDLQGKFVPKEPVQGAPAAKTGEGGQALAASPSPVEEPVWKRPPVSWKKDFHDVWKTADPRLQEYAYQREEQMRAGVEPLLPKAQLADAINKAAEPYMNTIRGMNIDLPTAVEGLMKADHQLRTLPFDQKIQYLASLARSYGIDLGAAMGQAPQQGQQVPDQQFYALQNEVLSLKGEIASSKQQEAAAKEAAALDEINRFAPQAEYFEEARPTMVSLLESRLAVSIPDAYEKAIRLNNDLFEADQQRTQAQAAQAQIVAKNTQAQRAKAAAVSVKGTTPGARTTTKAQTRREVLAEAFDSIDSRL